MVTVLADGHMQVEFEMGEKGTILVEKILGSRASPDDRARTIGIVAGGVEYKFDCSPDVLTNLALTALKAKSLLELNTRKKGAVEANEMHVFPCEGWEIRKSNDGAFLLFSFRVAGGAWVRIQVPTDAATLIRETLESIEGLSQSPPVTALRN